MRHAALLFVIFCACLDPAAAATYLVMPDGSGHFPTIQAALDAAVQHDIIELGDGIFTGEGNRDLDLHGKEIIVRSRSGDPHTCMIDCQGSAAAPHRGFYFHTAENLDCGVERITITGGYAVQDGGGIWCHGSASPWIEGCILSSNHAERFGGGAACEISFAAMFSHCTFAENSAGTAGGGLYAWLYATPYVWNCTFAGNICPLGAGIGCQINTVIEIRNTILAFNGPGAAIESELFGVDLECSDIYGNAGGDWTGYCAGQYGVAGNISEDPLFCDAGVMDFQLDASSPCAPHTPPGTGCDLIGAWPVGCESSSAPVADGLSTTGSLVRVTPNPTRAGTRIAYRIPAELDGASLTIEVLDVSGRRVRTVSAATATGGEHAIDWDGRDTAQRPLAPGIYFVRLLAGNACETRPLLIVR